MYFVMKTWPFPKPERAIGQGYLNLQTLLNDGRDALSVSVPLQGKEGAAGTLVVSLWALEAMQAATVV